MLDQFISVIPVIKDGDQYLNQRFAKQKVMISNCTLFSTNCIMLELCLDNSEWGTRTTEVSL